MGTPDRSLETVEITQRDDSIDFLRFLGAIAIMLAHADPPTWLAQLRNFGTPMLIIVSALSVVVVFRNRPFVTADFLRRRLPRVALPPWLFLTAFFGAALVVADVLGKPFPFTSDVVVGSYALTSGIGYLWVFKVYVIVALLTPVMIRFKEVMPNRAIYFAIIIGVYAGYEALYALLQARVHDDNVMAFVDDTLIVGLPYAVLFAYGLQLEELSVPTVMWISLGALLTFASFAVIKFQATGHFVLTQAFKYPPRLYYLSYALFCINNLYLLSKSAFVARLPTQTIRWVSTNLMWIYLWHIPGISVWDRLVGPTHGNLGLFSLKLVFIIGFGVSITFVQKRVVAALCSLRPGRVSSLASVFLG